MELHAARGEEVTEAEKAMKKAEREVSATIAISAARRATASTERNIFGDVVLGSSSARAV